MSPPGRPKGEYRNAQHEGTPVSPPSRPKGEYRSAQHEATPVSAWHSAMAVYRKELIDALRDRRTLFVVLVSSVLLGPLVLIALSGLLATFEAQAERREVLVVGIENAPGLKNFLLRQ